MDSPTESVAVELDARKPLGLRLLPAFKLLNINDLRDSIDCSDCSDYNAPAAFSRRNEFSRERNARKSIQVLHPLRTEAVWGV